MSSSFQGKSNLFPIAAAVVIIVIAIAITAAVQGSSEKTFSQIITVGPVWSTDAWTCTSDANFMVYGTLRGLAGSQISITVSESGTQSLYSMEPTQLESLSIGAAADNTIIITRTGTVSGFITLQTSSDATASCTSS